MAWEINFAPQAAKTFRKLDKPIQRRVSRYLPGCAAPQQRCGPIFINYCLPRSQCYCFVNQMIKIGKTQR